MKLFLVMAFLVALAGCATVNVPAFAKLKDSDKTLLQGSLTNDALVLNSVTGFSCTGGYSAYSFEPTVEMPITCNDGRAGTALVTFNETRASFLDKQPKKITGYGQGLLSDGTKFEIFIGRVSPSMKAPGFLK